MRRRTMGWVMVLAAGCGPVATEAPSEPGLAVAVAPPTPTVAPEPAPPELEAAPAAVAPSEERVEPSPAIVVDKLWSAEQEPRIVALQPLVAEAAAEHGVDPYLVNGVIWVESKFDRKAHNRSGARGLMQLMPKTAKSIGHQLGRPAKVFDAEFNVHAGTWYLSRMISKFDGDESLALAAYVRGPAKIRAWLDEGQAFPASVDGFVAKVHTARRVFAALGWPEIDPSPPAQVAPPPEGEAPAGAPAL